MYWESALEIAMLRRFHSNETHKGDRVLSGA